MGTNRNRKAAEDFIRKNHFDSLRRKNPHLDYVKTKTGYHFLHLN